MQLLLLLRCCIQTTWLRAPYVGTPLLKPLCCHSHGRLQVDSAAQLSVGQIVALRYKGGNFSLAREM